MFWQSCVFSFLWQMILRLMSCFKHFTLDGALEVLSVYYIAALLPESLKGTKSRKAARNDLIKKKRKRQDHVICRSWSLMSEVCVPASVCSVLLHLEKEKAAAAAMQQTSGHFLYAAAIICSVLLCTRLQLTSLSAGPSVLHISHAKHLLLSHNSQCQASELRVKCVKWVWWFVCAHWGCCIVEVWAKPQYI